MKITRKFLQARVDIVNGMLGFDVDALEYNTIGSIQLCSAYGATAVHRVVNDAHGVEAICELGTAREAASFLSGMIAALRIAQGERV